MPVLYRDFETRSAIDLRKCGAYRYASHPSTDVWCCAFAVDDGDIRVWIPGDDVPPELLQAARNSDWVVSSFNDQFERLIEREIMAPRYGWPQIPIEQHRCSQAAALALALPASLDGAAKALGLEQQKDDAGRRLMMQMARPRKPRTDEDPSKTYWFDDAERRARLYDYCKQDVATERALHQRISPLIPSEQKLWELDQHINDRGVFLDGTLIDSALALEGQLRRDIDAEISTITAGAVTSSHQVARLLDWLATQGCEVQKLGKAGLEALLTNGAAPAARRVIELRLQGAHAAAKKMQSMMAWRGAEGRARGMFKYCGAATGRWTSFGVQFQNLKRPTIDDLGAAIAAVTSGDVEALRHYPKPMAVIGDVTRAALCAAPGHRFIAADFSGVESRITAWLSGQQSKVDQWAKFDATGAAEDEPYLMLGRKLGVDEQHARSIGKTADLAFGYMGGAGAWRVMAPPGDKSTDDDVKRYQRLYRAEHPDTVLFWRKLNMRAIKAVRNPNTTIACGRVSFIFDGTFLFMTLPSGRRLAYPFARIETEGRRDPIVIFKDNARGKWNDCRDGEGAYGGTWIENAVQAVARDVFAAAMVRLEAAGYPIVLHVHDEIVSEVPDGVGSCEEFLRILTTPPDWADGMPIAAKVRNGPRFCKIDRPAPKDGAPAGEQPRGADKKMDYQEDYNFKDYQSGEQEWGGKIAEYIYRDKDGEPYLKVVKRRSENGKSFPQYHRENDRWVKGAPKGPRIPYRLPELLAAKPDEPVFVCEGEKDCENVAALGLVATTNPEGAGKWRDELNAWFVGKQIIYILEDNDDAGRAHVRKVAASLPHARVISFPELAEHGDVSDWLGQGHTKNDLLERAKAAKAAPKDHLSIITANTIEVRDVDWLWPERFPLGMIGLIAGLPDMGKGLITSFLAAAVTAGTPLPCGEGKASQGDVVWLTAEDDLNVTVVPRLMAAGANLQRIHFVKSVNKAGKDCVFNLQTDLPLLRNTILQHPNTKLSITDPVSAYLGVGKVDGRSATDVRGVLQPLKDMSEELRVFSLLIAHFNKKDDVKSALLRVSDSIAYVAAARSVYAVLEDPENKGARLLVKAKNNLARGDVPALRYSFALKPVPKLNKPQPYVVWESQVDITANEAMAAAGGHTGKQEAKAFLQERLEAGPVKAEDIIEEAKQDGIAKRTLDRAKKELGIKSHKEHGKIDGDWMWGLPPQKPPR